MLRIGTHVCCCSFVLAEWQQCVYGRWSTHCIHLCFDHRGECHHGDTHVKPSTNVDRSLYFANIRQGFDPTVLPFCRTVDEATSLIPYTKISASVAVLEALSSIPGCSQKHLLLCLPLGWVRHAFSTIFWNSP